MEQLFDKIAEELYSKFVVNKSVLGVQQPNGIYLATKAFVSPFLIKKMLTSGSAFGVYQQLTFKERLRWICFDFDCTKDAGGNPLELKDKYVIPFLKKLDTLNISYISEFSGRRGFHIWILLNCSITKDLGFKLVKALIGEIEEALANDDKYGIDLFPKSGSGKKKNKYGSMVKIPLSRHQKGTYSYFVENISAFSGKTIVSLETEFLKQQLNYLKKCKVNDAKELVKKIDFGEIETDEYKHIEKQILYVNGSYSFKDLETAFKSDEALAIIWDHIVNGCMTIRDRKIILGAFAHVSEGEKILYEIFEKQDNYNASITAKEIQKNKNYYFPIGMYLLHSIYGVSPCKDEQSVSEYLFNKLGIPFDKAIFRKKLRTSLIDDVVNKEKQYFMYNDEVINTKIRQDLDSFSFYDRFECNRIVHEVIEGSFTPPEKIEYYLYHRKEVSKTRNMISLGAKERVITTALIFELIRRIQENHKSYSYHLNIAEGGDVFYPWISSWKNFINDISIFFSLKLLEDYHFIKADLTACYDSIYLASLQKTFLKKYESGNPKNTEIRRICDYLISFNEKLQSDYSKTGKGVPQGPAYARVLVELTLDSMLNIFWNENESLKDKVKIFRYVDDMYIFHEDSLDGIEVLKRLSSVFERFRLFFNKDKTMVYGKIANIPREKKDSFGGINQMMYDVQQDGALLSGDEMSISLDKYVLRNNVWDINDANFILSDCVDKFQRIQYISHYFEKIVQSEIGRGSVFRKFYKNIFSDYGLLNIFLNKTYYKQIPIQSINFKNFVYQLYHYTSKGCEITLLNNKILESVNTILKKDNIDCDDYNMLCVIKQNLEIANA
ncbi:reverse transcriptase domain-containing protein [Fibrobacter sp. UBA4297]|uniref:reverse transcriptase domain-containing protein n=1 Tax=Fibrobacter sp. UBA4297 TaxID=1946536 RepID=UPI0025C6F6ED|nr:reverse transcriptase domain-containing protein [Fibrobacter sp. UBA4297]